MVQLIAALGATLSAPGISEAPPALSVHSRSDLLAIAPGQLWIVEMSPEASHLPPREHRAFVAANVVIYDRGLGRLVAATLPLGNYAEPVPVSGPAPDGVDVERCLRFALEGWSVVRLVDAGRTPSAAADRLLRVAARLIASGVVPDTSVRLLIEADSGEPEEIETCLDDLPDALQALSLNGRLTVVFGIASRAAPPPYAAAANGLAG